MLIKNIVYISIFILGASFSYFLQGIFSESPDKSSSGGYEAETSVIIEKEVVTKYIQDDSFSLKLNPPIHDKYWITSQQGTRISPITQRWSVHYGQDMTSRSDDVYAVLEGTVITAWPSPKQIGYRKDGSSYYFKGHAIYGGFVEIYHPSKGISRYGHLDSVSVSEGQKVTVTDKIGTIGETGLSNGKHLHFEFVINPKFFIKK